MTDLDVRCLDAFPKWLRTLSEDALDLALVLDDEESSEATRHAAARALNYLFKSLDLIPDGIEDLGLLDDAFVFRAAAALAGEESIGSTPIIARLAEDAALVREFLDADYPRLEAFVRGLDDAVARGRVTREIVGDVAVRGAFAGDVRGWAGSYVAPPFGRDVKNLVKLRAFLKTKLPA